MLELIILFLLASVFFLLMGVFIHCLLEKKQKTSRKIETLTKQIEAIWQEKSWELTDAKKLYKLSKQIKRQADKEYLYEYLRDKNKQDKKWVQSFIIESSVLTPHLRKKSKDLFNQLFMIKSVGQFHLVAYEAEILALLDEENRHIEANGLKTLSSLRNAEILLDGMERIKAKKSVLSDEFLVDCLASFKGDKSRLNRLMVQRLKEKKALSEKVYIHYFENIAYHEAADIIYKYLDKEDSQLRKVIFKYFIKVKYEPIKEIFNTYLIKGDLEERILAAKGLALYPEEEVVRTLQKGLEDEDYRVREASAKSFYRLLSTHEMLYLVLEEQEQEIEQLVENMVSKSELLSTYWQNSIS